MEIIAQAVGRGIPRRFTTGTPVTLNLDYGGILPPHRRGPRKGVRPDPDNTGKVGPGSDVTDVYF